MTKLSLRSSATLPMFSIAVDLEPRSGSPSVRGEALTWTTRRLVELFNSAGQPVTWFARDPAAHEALRWAREADVAHEAAIVTSDAWHGAEEGRSRLVSELLRSKNRAQQAGWTIGALAFDRLPPREHFDFLVRQGISAICVATATGVGALRRRPQQGLNSLRFGLWRSAPDHRIGGGGHLSRWLNVRKARRAVDRAAAAGAALHWVVDAPAIARSSSGSSLGGLEALLNHLRQRTEAGDLEVGTIAQQMAKLMQPRAARAACSILRAA